MKVFKKVIASGSMLLVFLGLGMLVGDAGGAEWGTEGMGAAIACAILFWVCAQPIIWIGGWEE